MRDSACRHKQQVSHDRQASPKVPSMCGWIKRLTTMQCIKQYATGQLPGSSGTTRFSCQHPQRCLTAGGLGYSTEQHSCGPAGAGSPGSSWIHLAAVTPHNAPDSDNPSVSRFRAGARQYWPQTRRLRTHWFARHLL